MIILNLTESSEIEKPPKEKQNIFFSLSDVRIHNEEINRILFCKGINLNNGHIFNLDLILELFNANIKK